MVNKTSTSSFVLNYSSYCHRNYSVTQLKKVRAEVVHIFSSLIDLSLCVSDRFHFSTLKQQVLEYALDRAEVRTFFGHMCISL